MKETIEKLIKLMNDGCTVNFRICYNDQTETRIFAAAYKTFDYSESLNALIFGYSDGTINIIMLENVKIIEITLVNNGVDLSFMDDGEEDDDEYIC